VHPFAPFLVANGQSAAALVGKSIPNTGDVGIKLNLSATARVTPDKGPRIALAMQFTFTELKDTPSARQAGTKETVSATKSTTAEIAPGGTYVVNVHSHQYWPETNSQPLNQGKDTLFFLTPKPSPDLLAPAH